MSLKLLLSNHKLENKVRRTCQRTSNIHTFVGSRFNPISAVQYQLLYRMVYPSMLWFKFFFGLIIFFKPVLFLFTFVSEYDNEFETMETKNLTGLKVFKLNISTTTYCIHVQD